MGFFGPTVRFSAAVLRALASKVGRITAASGPQVSRIAARLGLSGAKATANNIKELAKNNKFAAAVILYELYGATDETLQAMIGEDAELGRMVELFGFEPDTVAQTDSVTDISRFGDEFAIISEAAATLGSFERLMVLRQALSLGLPTYQLYQSVKMMKKKVI